MTPETMVMLLKRQSPEQRKTMLFALRLSPLAIERFIAGEADLVQQEQVEGWLSGRYAMTAESDGFVLIPRRPVETRSTPGLPPAQPVGKVGPRAITGLRKIADAKPLTDKKPGQDVDYIQGKQPPIKLPRMFGR